MKLPITLLIFLISTSILSAQLFSKLENDPIVTEIADSRSVNIVDVNNDDWEDVFISNGLKDGQNDLLYFNNGNGTFTKSNSDITSDGKPSVGASFADYNNDGFIDAYVTNWYGQINGLFLNSGDGLFELMNSSTIAPVASYAETATWGDFDNDGKLDLYVTNSGNSGNSNSRKNILYHQSMPGEFTRVDTGIAVLERGYSRNADWVDLDHDGDLDLLVSNENSRVNNLYHNEGNGHFIRQMNHPLVIERNSTMGFSTGDIDNDGDLDLFFANAGYFQEENNLLFRNQNGDFVADKSSVLSSDNGCSFGSSFGDYDNDGDLDLVVVNGYCNSNLQNYLYENQGDGTFAKVTNAFAELQSVCSYGVAWGDLDNDGFLDLVVANCNNNSPVTTPSNDVLFNNGNSNNWIKIKLVGTVSNRSAIGAKVYMTAIINGETVTQFRTISSQTGYAGQNSLIAHFGLRDATSVSKVMIEWPSGMTSTHENISANILFSSMEGESTGISSAYLSEHEIELKPNPNMAYFVLSFSNPFAMNRSFQLKIINAQGKVVAGQLLPSTEKVNEKVNVSNLPSGIYELIIECEGRYMGRKRFVKQ